MKRTKNCKLSNKVCCYCEYCVCRKGHKCSWYKKFVKKYHRKRDRMSFAELCERNVAAEYWTGRME